MSNDKPATIRDVARLANVSAATVSRYLNGHLSVPLVTETRINEAVKRLNYTANHSARTLSLGRSKMLGLVLPDIENAFFASFASAAESHAYANGYSLILCNTCNDPAREAHYLDLLKSRQLDALILLPTTTQLTNEQMVNLDGLPIVIADENIPKLDVSRVFVDNSEGGYLATRHLIESGHRAVAHIAGPPLFLSGKERLEGYRRALDEYGIPFRDEYVIHGPYETGFGKEASLSLLELALPPTAIFAASDITALGVLQAVRELNLRIPQNVSLVGFDDMPYAQLLSPALTTVRQPVRDMGRCAVDAIVKQLAGTLPRKDEIRLPVALILRDSVSLPNPR
jgi:LacI family transcriptional regulator